MLVEQRYIALECSYCTKRTFLTTLWHRRSSEAGSNSRSDSTKSRRRYKSTMDPKTKLFEELRDNGFKLARKRNHLVFQNDAGLEWIVPNTPSDSRAYQNNLADFRLFLQRGTARGKFGDKPVSPREREHFERSLRPVLEKKAKEARERSLGIPREKFERMKMTRAGTAASLAPVASAASDENLQIDAAQLQGELLASMKDDPGLEQVQQTAITGFTDCFQAIAEGMSDADGSDETKRLCDYWCRKAQGRAVETIRDEALHIFSQIARWIRHTVENRKERPSLPDFYERLSASSSSKFEHSLYDAIWQLSGELGLWIEAAPRDEIERLVGEIDRLAEPFFDTTERVLKLLFWAGYEVCRPKLREVGIELPQLSEVGLEF